MIHAQKFPNVKYFLCCFLCSFIFRAYDNPNLIIGFFQWYILFQLKILKKDSTQKNSGLSYWTGSSLMQHVHSILKTKKSGSSKIKHKKRVTEYKKKSDQGRGKLIIRFIGPTHVLKWYTTLLMVLSVLAKYTWRNLFRSKFVFLMLDLATLKIEWCYKRIKSKSN